MKKYIKLLIAVMVISIVLMAINYLFFTETGQIRSEISKSDITSENNTYYLNVANYKHLKLPKEEFEKIDLETISEYKISFKYNNLFEKGNVDLIQK